MPIGRYFICVGSVLLALLFYAEGYFPDNAVTLRGEVDKTILRIKSDHKWPERIVIDTSLPTIVAPPAVADSSPQVRDPREAFASIPAPPSAAVSLPASRPAANPERRPTPRMAKRADEFLR